MADSRQAGGRSCDRPPEDFPVELLPVFVYMRTKALRYVKMAPEDYRRHDAFDMPPEECDDDLLAKVRVGMEQLAAWRGWKKELPLEDLDVDGFHALATTLHFELVEQAAEVSPGRGMLDTIQLRHHVTGEEIVLYNLVEEDFIIEGGDEEP